MTNTPKPDSSRKPRQTVNVLLSLLAGLVAGAIPALWDGCTGPTTDGVTQASAPPPPPRFAPAEYRRGAAQPLPARAPAPFDTNTVPEHVDAGAPSRPRAPRRTVPEQQEIDRQVHAALLEEHRLQPADPNWARTVEERLQTGLTALAITGGFDVGAIDCRSTSCSAELTWSSYDDALNNYSPVVEDPTLPGCTRRITLPPPEQCISSCDVRMLVDCKPLSTPSLGAFNVE